MAQLTIRSDDKELLRRLKKLAREKGISLNQAALRLMRKGAGIAELPENVNRVGSALDSFIGTWADEEAEDMINAVADLRIIDETLWQ